MSWYKREIWEAGAGADNRGGVSCLVNLLKFLFQNNVEYTPLTCLFTVREESGLWGARNVDKKDLGSPEIGFNTDGSSPYELSLIHI